MYSFQSLLRISICTEYMDGKSSMYYIVQLLIFIANEPAERRRSAGEAAENSAARRMAYAKNFSIEL